MKIHLDRVFMYGSEIGSFEKDGNTITGSPKPTDHMTWEFEQAIHIVEQFFSMSHVEQVKLLSHLKEQEHNTREI